MGDCVILESGSKPGPLEFGREDFVELVEQSLTNDIHLMSSPWPVGGRGKEPPVLEGLLEIIELSLILRLLM